MSIDSGRGKSAEGVVVRGQGRYVKVRVGDRELRCALRGTLFRNVGAFTNPVATGDRVRVTVFRNGGVVEEVLPRRGYLSRLVGDPPKEQVIVANVDQVLITVSLDEPEFRPRIIDRILVAAERGRFRGLIALTKVDLVNDRGPYEDYAELYRGLGYEVLFLSNHTGEGLPALRAELTDRTTVLSGQSGVGKSTLLNSLQPKLLLRAQTVSEKWGKGRHTTTDTRLLALDFGGYVVDTPGIRAFGIAGLDPSDISIFFRDMAPFIDACRYPQCIHDHEPDCGVKDAVEAGQIDLRRYESYLRILMGMDDEDDPSSRS